MDSNLKQIKIKLDVPENAIAYKSLREQWENEGGATESISSNELILVDQLPFKPGDIFKVIACRENVIEGELFLLADIKQVT